MFSWGATGLVLCHCKWSSVFSSKLAPCSSPLWLPEGVLHSFINFSVSPYDQGAAFEENTGRGGLWRFAVLSEELTFHLLQLQRQTEQELSNIRTQWVNDLLCTGYKGASVYVLWEGTQRLNVFTSVSSLLSWHLQCEQGGCLLRVWRMFCLLTYSTLESIANDVPIIITPFQLPWMQNIIYTCWLSDFRVKFVLDPPKNSIQDHPNWVRHLNLSLFCALFPWKLFKTGQVRLQYLKALVLHTSFALLSQN